MKLKGFTLTELLIALAVLGLLIAILTPVISNLLPDQNALMAKRTFYAIQTITSDLINDEACYPDITQAILDSDKRVGFDDGWGYADCMKWGGVENTDKIDTANATDKFILLFKDRLDTTSNTEASFQTGDDVRWLIQSTGTGEGFTNNNANSFIRIAVDTNGSENPNCSQAGKAAATIATGGNSCTGRTSDFDIYTVKVYADGRLEIEDEWAKKAVKLSKNVISDETPKTNTQPNSQDDCDPETDENCEPACDPETDENCEQE